jgi:hypothetical protein
MGEFLDAFVSVIHSHTDTTFSFVFVDFHSLYGSVVTREDNFELSWLVDGKISGLVLITESVSSYNDGLLPSWDKSWNIVDNDRLSKYGTIQVISDGSVGAFPHFLKAELFDSGLIWGDSCALDSHLALADSLGSFKSYFVISLISIFHTQIKVLDLQVQKRKD